MNRIASSTRCGIQRPWVAGLGIGLITGVSGLLPAEPVAADEPVPQAAIRVIQAEDEPIEGELDLSQFSPGFILPMAEEDLGKQIGRFSFFMEKEAWGEAFRVLSELDNNALDVMVQVSDDKLYMAVRVQIQDKLLAMPSDGVRAYRLYFDGQAKELFKTIQNHKLPGSEQQLALAQQLVGRLLMTSIGGEAAELLGDLYFERGQFTQARHNWSLALEHGQSTGGSAIRLQTKIVLALQRGKELEQAANLYQQLQARYNQTAITIGGEEVDALALLGRSLGQIDATDLADRDADQAPPIVLPEDATLPQWQMVIIDEETRKVLKESNTQRGYYYNNQPSGILDDAVPMVVADDQNVYFHWLGAVYALDRESGKIIWDDRLVDEIAPTVRTRMSSNASDPQNYQVALAEQALLVSHAPFQGNNAQFTLTGYDKQSGKTLWQSSTRQDWGLTIGDQSYSDTSLLGEILVDGSSAYAVIHRASATDCFLRRFDPETGEVQWTLPLGAADPVTYSYPQIRRMPQPILLMNSGLLYVVMNNGGLLAVDVSAVEIAWARRLDPPMGVGKLPNDRFAFQQMNSQNPDGLTNPNGSGGIMLQGRTLYVKEHYSKKLYALDAYTGALAWAAGSLKPDAKLIGIDDKRFYLMSRSLEGYELDGDHDLDWSNGVQTGQPRHGAALINGDQILVMTPDRLRQFNPENGDMAAQFEQEDYLGPTGGRLYRFDDLLICINETEITAFQLNPIPPE